jgi:hypothetical protein
MYTWKVKGVTYNIRFTYGILYNSDLLDVLTSTKQPESLGEAVKSSMAQLPELLLAGLQKYHATEFSYSNDEEKKVLVNKIWDMIDDYEDESTEENPQNGATLLEDLTKELEKNGFLARLLTMAENANTKDMKKAATKRGKTE